MRTTPVVFHSSKNTKSLRLKGEGFHPSQSETLKDQTRITMIPGGGIHKDNVQLFLDAGFSEIHLSATKQHQTIEVPRIPMNSLKHYEETRQTISDIEIIKNIISKINV